MKAKLNLPFSGKKNRFSFNCNHETTMNFGSILPAFHADLAPGETMSVDTRFFARVAPMKVPTFADVRVRIMSYFVPYSSCWEYFDDFISARPTAIPNDMQNPDVQMQYVQFDDVPTIKEMDLVSLFTQVNSGEVSSSSVFWEDGTANKFDYIIRENNTTKYFLFTRTGKVAFQILQALGYNFSFLRGVSSNAISYNALPLLAFCKLFYEHYIPQQYKQNNYWRNFQQKLHDMYGSSANMVINQSMLIDLLCNFVLSYKQDYFTSMWQEPNFPVSSYIDFPQEMYAPMAESNDNAASGDYTGVSDAEQRTGLVAAQTGDNGGITPWTMSMAQKLQGYLTRNGLAGSDFINRQLAEHGVKPVSNIGRVQFCGSYETQLKIDSVFDTAGASASGAPLGSYAGRGIMGCNAPKFDVSTKEYGMLFVLSTVLPVTSFTDGVDRNLLYRSRFDFFTPDFDGKNMQAVAMAELFNTFYCNTSESIAAATTYQVNNPTRILGFNPRYAERKMLGGNIKNRVTGDFNVHSLSTNVAPYSLQRNLFVDKFAPSALAGLKLSSGSLGVLNLSDLVYQKDASQYNRLFTDTTGLPDPFFCLFDFNVKLFSHMLPIKDSFEQFNSDSNSIDVEKNGQYNN